MIIPKEISDKTYPAFPQNFGEKLRKARMDSGLQIKEVAAILGVKQDTVIDWELRGMRPRGQNLEKVKFFIAARNSNEQPTTSNNQQP